jgi:hypothetical protein
VVRRYLDLARAAGIEPGGFEVSPDGTLRVLPKAPPAKTTLFDQLEDRL